METRGDERSERRVENMDHEDVDEDCKTRMMIAGVAAGLMWFALFCDGSTIKDGA